VSNIFFKEMVCSKCSGRVLTIYNVYPSSITIEKTCDCPSPLLYEIIIPEGAVVIWNEFPRSYAYRLCEECDGEHIEYRGVDFEDDRSRETIFKSCECSAPWAGNERWKKIPDRVLLIWREHTIKRNHEKYKI